MTKRQFAFQEKDRRHDLLVTKLRKIKKALTARRNAAAGGAGDEDDRASCIGSDSAGSSVALDTIVEDLDEVRGGRCEARRTSSANSPDSRAQQRAAADDQRAVGGGERGARRSANVAGRRHRECESTSVARRARALVDAAVASARSRTRRSARSTTRRRLSSRRGASDGIGARARAAA